ARPPSPTRTPRRDRTAPRPGRGRPSRPPGSLVVRSYWWRTGDVVSLGQRLVDPVGQQRHVDVADPVVIGRVLDRVQDRVDECGRAADRGAFADALGADRMVRAGRDDLVQLVAGGLP